MKWECFQRGRQIKNILRIRTNVAIATVINYYVFVAVSQSYQLSHDKKLRVVEVLMKPVWIMTNL